MKKVYLLVHMPGDASRQEDSWERGIYDGFDKVVTAARKLHREDSNDLTTIYVFNLNEDDSGEIVWDCGEIGYQPE